MTLFNVCDRVTISTHGVNEGTVVAVAWAEVLSARYEEFELLPPLPPGPTIWERLDQDDP